MNRIDSQQLKPNGERSEAAALQGPRHGAGGAMKIGRFFRRRAEDAEMEQEIEAHIVQETDDNVARECRARRRGDER